MPRVRVERSQLHEDREPVDLLIALRDRPHLVALIGRWHDGAAIIAWDPLVVADPHADPFSLLGGGHALPDADREDGHRFGGGWIGSWGYQLGAGLEQLGKPPPRPDPQPPHRIAFYDRVLVRRSGTWWFERLAGIEDPDIEEERRSAFLRDLAAAHGRPRPYSLGTVRAVPDGPTHEAAVRRTREAIAAGELFQANITMRLEAPFTGAPVDLFVRGWRRLRPEFAAFLGWPGSALASFSPELFLRRRGRSVLTSPIKGTAPTDSNPHLLAASVKDRAENVMIVDLMRNDLARVCVPGSVRVPALNRVEEHAVRHLVSDVVGELRPGIEDGDLLRATFPPGSVTGAPKVAALRLINAVETTAREAYTGAIGYASPAAGLELSVAIRTFEFAGDNLWLGVGGGITTLSDPAEELAECHDKADPLLSAVGAGASPRAQPNRPSRSEAPAPAGPAPAAPAPVQVPYVAVTSHRTAQVLVIDNYDSFVHNLAHYVEEAGARAVVVRNDAISLSEVEALRLAGALTHLLVSPGPAAPDRAGISVAAIRLLGPTTPVLGVCLGHQAVGAAFGAKVVRASRPVHGRTDILSHDGRGLLAGLPQGVAVARYHSLVVDPGSLPECLEPTSWGAEGELMGVRHRLHAHIEGVQWHPESILTEHGRAVIEAFLRTRVREDDTPSVCR